METDRKKAIRGPGRPDGAVFCEVSPIRQSTAMPRRGVSSDAGRGGIPALWSTAGIPRFVSLEGDRQLSHLQTTSNNY